MRMGLFCLPRWRANICCRACQSPPSGVSASVVCDVPVRTLADLLRGAHMRPGASPDEMIVARRWVAARFQGVQEVPPLETGLTVAANYGPVQKDGRGEKPLRIGDTRYSRGFYCHANSRIAVRLPAACRHVYAVMGVDTNDQTTAGRGSVVFSRGGRRARRCFVRSRCVKACRPCRFSVDLQGAREFALIVSDAGDGISCDQADWADAKVVLADNQTLG